MSSAAIDSHSVVVVGAGLAGLYAAKLLQQRFPGVIVLEATAQPGGRVKQVHGIAPWPVEAGPQFVHGANSSLMTMLNQMQCGIKEYPWPDWWYFGKEHRFVKAPEKDEGVETTHRLFSEVGSESYPETDISGEQWLRNKGVSHKVLAIADACYANDFGCSLHQLGLRELITENQKWDSGDSYLVLDCPLSALVQHIAKTLNKQIHCNCPVSRIEHDAKGAVITLYGGRQIRCRHVVVTVPITVLQRDEITFSPPLPQLKQQAIQRVKMSNAIKVIMMFAQPFWPDGFFDVVCTDSFIPEFWVTDPPLTPSHSQRASATTGLQDVDKLHHAQQQQSTPVHCMVGFVAGSRAEEISKLRQNSVIIQTLSQLDEMFGTRRQRFPATSSFLNATIVDWSREKHIHGAYTYPTLHAQVGDRDVLAQPIGTTIFFAGEATHPAINPCMQAAMETGQRAAAELLKCQVGCPTSSKL
ncbi:hypothetical protein ABBQ32_007941 [Trebouxia sp. C0010 RCD-2024]